MFQKLLVMNHFTFHNDSNFLISWKNDKKFHTRQHDLCFSSLPKKHNTTRTTRKSVKIYTARKQTSRKVFNQRPNEAWVESWSTPPPGKSVINYAMASGTGSGPKHPEIGPTVKTTHTLQNDIIGLEIIAVKGCTTISLSDWMLASAAKKGLSFLEVNGLCILDFSIFLRFLLFVFCV